MRKSDLLLILILIGLNYTNADGDDSTTEAISDTTEFITETKVKVQIHISSVPDNASHQSIAEAM
jgi:hypothetical protein